MKRDRLKVGVIGTGYLGEYHVQKYKAVPDVELVGVFDIDLNRAGEIARRYGTSVCNEMSDLLNKVDAVSLAVPTQMHFDLAKEVLSGGVHLLVEKPITSRVEQADVLVRMAADKGLVLQVGHVERFNPAVVKMESLLNGPIFIESHRMNLFTPRGIDVDVVLDLMIHDLDIILHVVPSEIKEVQAVGMSVMTHKTDIANVRIIFENGAVANLTASRVSNRTLRKIRIFQPDAYLSVDCAKREISVTRLDGNVEGSDRFPQVVSNKLEYPGSDPLADQIASFVHVVLAGKEPVVSGRDGRNALKAAYGIIDQIDKGCRHFQAIL